MKELTMRMNPLAGVLVVAVAMVVAGSAAGQSREAAIKASLTKIEKGTIKASSEGARKEADIVTGRRELTALYDQAPQADKSSVAADVSRLAVPLVNKLEGERALQLGLALAAIHDAAVQPALEAMVTHKDAPVRLLGWRGYVWTDPDNQVDSVREQLIKQNPDGAAVMWKTLAARFDTEISSVVFGPMFEMMRLSTMVRRVTGPAVDTANMALVDKAWASVCQKIVSGDEEMMRSARSALMTMKYFYDTGDDKQKANVTRCFVEMFYCTAMLSDQLTVTEVDRAETGRQLLLDLDALLGSSAKKTLPEDKSLKTALAAKQLALDVDALIGGLSRKTDLNASLKSLNTSLRMLSSEDSVRELAKKVDDLTAGKTTTMDERTVRATLESVNATLRKRYTLSGVASDWGAALGVSMDEMKKTYTPRIRVEETPVSATVEARR